MVIKVSSNSEISASILMIWVAEMRSRAALTRPKKATTTNTIDLNTYSIKNAVRGLGAESTNEGNMYERKDFPSTIDGIALDPAASSMIVGVMSKLPTIWGKALPATIPGPVTKRGTRTSVS